MATDIVIPEKERWTYEDYMNLTPSDSFGFQIIRGILVVSPSPKRRHQRTILSLGRILDIYVNAHNWGEMFIAPFDVILDADQPEPENIVQPDLMFVSREHMDIVTDDNIQGAPDLVVEVLSDSTARYDRVGKMSVYAEFGVKEYWILDTNAQFLESFDLTGAHPQLVASLGGDDVFKPELFPDLEISLSDLWYPEKDDSDGKDT
jgi:Uma2 family endonuclease